MEPCNIDVDMAYLEIGELNSPSNDNTSKRELESATSTFSMPNSEDNPRRSTRKRCRIAAPTPTYKARVILQPKKIVDGTTKETMKYYMDKRIRRLHPSLETIFEVPQNESMMSVRKFKRLIEFPAAIGSKDKVKTKRRSMKAKKISPIKNLKKVSMDFLMQKLSVIEETEIEADNSENIG